MKNPDGFVTFRKVHSYHGMEYFRFADTCQQRQNFLLSIVLVPDAVNRTEYEYRLRTEYEYEKTRIARGGSTRVVVFNEMCLEYSLFPNQSCLVIRKHSQLQKIT